jgi:hypothetical protein
MSLDVYLTTNKCAACGHSDEVYWSNITHNLGAMAEEAGIYKHLWRPEEIDIKTACQLVRPLKVALIEMKADPERFKKHNASNGWGTYPNFIEFVEKYLAACELNPDAEVSVSR